MSILHGLSPVPVEKCRVLEIACGDGSNLIPMAYAIPTSEFVGFDLARLPIERGLDRIRELGLKNIHLFQQELLEAGAELGRFDYIIAHGLYAWVPEPVRDRLLALMNKLLAENGVAFVSYNAMPGSYLRCMVRDMMRFYAEGIDGLEEQAAAGLQFLHFLSEARPEGDLYRTLLENQWTQIEKRKLAVTCHDELAGVHHPVYFIEFADHARRHGLQYLGEAELPPPPDPCYKAEIRSAMESTVGGDVLRQEQCLDFLRMRNYRETLLCRSDRVLRRDFPAEHFRKLLFASQAVPTPNEASGTTAFVLPGGIRMESNHPGLTVLITELQKVWPAARNFEEIEPRLEGTGLALDAQGAGLLIRLAVAKMIELRTWRAPMVQTIPERPRASICSRQEARMGTLATSLLHLMISLEDGKVRCLLRLLDGTRDRNSLLRALKAEFPAIAEEEMEAGLDGSLRFFHAAGILEA
jgi:ubiquinone/menaquinone biosynthesis C-methylase UbiE